jgi:membrane protein DedA with SNARE-associated domain/membrane-associated phospholipid phosphatase
MAHTQLFPVIAHYIEAIIINGGYGILFITTLIEGVPLFGMAVPGHVTIILGGFLAKIGTLNLYWVLIISMLGAVLGDFIGFYIGRRYGMNFIERMRPYFFIRNDHITRAQDLLARHTGKALIIGRFSPITRALMPFLVGVSGIKATRFWLFNILGGVSWVVISVGLGYIFGASYHAAVGYLGKFMVVAIIAIILILWGYKFVNMRFHIFTRYEIFTLIFNVVSLLVLARTIQDALAPASFLAQFDVQVNLFVGAHITQTWIYIAHWISKIGDSEYMLIAGTALSLWLAWYKKWRRSALTILTMISTGFFLSVLKDFFVRPRPENAYQFLSSFSFPSGHATFAAAFFFVVAYLLVTHMRSVYKRELVIVVCVLAVILIGLSRIILSVHWATDVIAGWALGIFLATSSILFVRYVGALLRKHTRNVLN